MPRMLKLVVIAAVSWFVVAGHSALAGPPPSCSLSDGTLWINGYGGGNVEIVRAGDAIEVLNLGAGCTGEAPTVQNVDTVDVKVDQTALTLSLRAGPFTPGATQETDGSSEIEFMIEAHTVVGEGSRLMDEIDLGETPGGWGADLGSDNDVDWFFARSGLDVAPTRGRLYLRLGSGNDVLDGTGGSKAFSGPYARRPAPLLWASGEGGADRIIGGTTRNVIEGGWGADQLIGNEKIDYLQGGQGRDRLDGKGGRDHLKGEGGVDLILGGASSDRISPKDGLADEVHCGRGRNDKVYFPDRTDRLFGCEKIVRW